MQRAAVLEQNTPLPENGGTLGEENYVLNVTVVYEDTPTRQWAGDVCDRVIQLVGREAVRCIWWKMGDLSEPAVLAGAVSTAMRADVIVVAIRAVEGLPLPFYVWVDSWLPHHPPNETALVALVAIPERPSASQERAREYLRAVARQGRMDFLAEERKLPVASPDSSFELRRERCPTVSLAPPGVRGRSWNGSIRHWQPDEPRLKFRARFDSR